MAIWPDNQTRYSTRFHAFVWFCSTFYNHMSAKLDGEYVVPFTAPNWGGMPEDIRDQMTLKDLWAMRDAVTDLRDQLAHGGAIQALTIDDVLEYLNWSFNPGDIKDVKITYISPKDPTKAPKKRKKHEQS